MTNYGIYMIQSTWSANYVSASVHNCDTGKVLQIMWIEECQSYDDLLDKAIGYLNGIDKNEYSYKAYISENKEWKEYKNEV